jgi:hypothetical protein
MGYDLNGQHGTWGMDSSSLTARYVRLQKASMQSDLTVRLRLGTLIMDSNCMWIASLPQADSTPNDDLAATVMNLHGLRALVYSMPTKVEGSTESIQATRRSCLLAAISKHPLWSQSTKDLRSGTYKLLGGIPEKVSLKPRVSAFSFVVSG